LLFGVPSEKVQYEKNGRATFRIHSDEPFQLGDRPIAGEFGWMCRTRAGRQPAAFVVRLQLNKKARDVVEEPRRYGNLYELLSFVGVHRRRSFSPYRMVHDPVRVRPAGRLRARLVVVLDGSGR